MLDGMEHADWKPGSRQGFASRTSVCLSAIWFLQSARRICTTSDRSPVSTFSHMAASRSADLGHLSRMKGQISRPQDVPAACNQRATDFRPGKATLGTSILLVHLPVAAEHDPIIHSLAALVCMYT